MRFGMGFGLGMEGVCLVVQTAEGGSKMWGSGTVAWGYGDLAGGEKLVFPFGWGQG